MVREGVKGGGTQKFMGSSTWFVTGGNTEGENVRKHSLIKVKGA